MVYLDRVLALPLDREAALTARADFSIDRNWVSLIVDPHCARISGPRPWQR